MTAKLNAMGENKASTIDEYIAGYPPDVQRTLSEIRTIIKKAVPDAEETISYAMPTFKIDGVSLVHFACFKSHIGLYPAPTGVEPFKSDFVGFKTGKGSVQFPLDKPVPLELISGIVQFRLKQIGERADNRNK